MTYTGPERSGHGWSSYYSWLSGLH